MALNAKKYYILFFSCSILFLGLGCKKSKLNKETITAEDNAIAEEMFNDVFKVMDEAAKEQDLNKTTETGYLFSNSCAEVIVEHDIPGEDFPLTVTVNFGEENCEGGDGRMRRGKLEAVFSGKYREEGTTIVISTENYFVNDYKVVGSKTITNMGRNQYGNLYFKRIVDGKVVYPAGEEISLKNTHYFTWIEGEETTFFTWTSDSTSWLGFEGVLDDVYMVTGEGTGANRRGRPYSYSITHPLKVKFCNWLPNITEGVIEINPEDLKKRTVNFGLDNCKREAIVTIGKRENSIEW